MTRALADNVIYALKDIIRDLEKGEMPTLAKLNFAHKLTKSLMKELKEDIKHECLN